MTKFRVIRPHQGDTFYQSGDVRIANPTDVTHLVRLGVLAPVEDDAQAKADAEAKARDVAATQARADAEAQAKSVAAAPQNKAVQPPANK